MNCRCYYHIISGSKLQRFKVLIPFLVLFFLSEFQENTLGFFPYALGSCGVKMRVDCINRTVYLFLEVDGMGILRLAKPC